MTTPGSSRIENSNDEILHEMHRQLKAASRIVMNLKSKVEDLTKHNAQLQESQRENLLKIEELEKINQELQGMINPSSLNLTEELDLLKTEIRRLKEQEIAKSKPDRSENSDSLSSIADANKKVKLAQDHMAKMIARHRREVQDWVSKCESLEKNVETSKVLEIQFSFTRSQSITSGFSCHRMI